jgi:GNAT superfamily N-acetyltransferase
MAELARRPVDSRVRGTIRVMAAAEEIDASGTSTSRYRSTVGEADAELHDRLSDELGKVNAEATPATAPARELTIRVRDDMGELAAGMSGWTWGVAAGIGMTWVRADSRGVGLGASLLAEFESEARSRGCTHVFVTSFTFQAPGFYERHGYRELFRWNDVPVAGASDVHFRKEL